MTDQANARRQQADADRLRAALTRVWLPLPGQKAALQPAFNIDVTWLGHMDATVAVEEIAGWVEAL
jgi:hypothetical protein